MATLDRAIDIATEAHAGQVDKAGQPYIEHPIRVMCKLHDEPAKIVAILHDVLEDCPTWSASRLAGEGFDEEVIDAVVALTRVRGETYDAFIDRVALNPLAARVKVADLRDNMNLRRLPTLTEADVQRNNKYARALARLLDSPRTE